MDLNVSMVSQASQIDELQTQWEVLSGRNKGKSDRSLTIPSADLYHTHEANKLVKRCGIESHLDYFRYILTKVARVGESPWMLPAGAVADIETRSR